MRTALFVGGVALLALGGCAPPADQAGEPAPLVAPDAATVEQLVRAWDDAMNSGDAGRTADLYSATGTMMPPESPVLRGPDDIRGYVEQMHAAGKITVEDQLTAYHASAEEIAAHGTWTLDMAPAGGGEAVQDSGRWIALWERQPNGSWAIRRNIWNSDRLPEGMDAPPGAGLEPADEVPEPDEPVCPSSPSAVDDAFVSTFEDGDVAGVVAVHNADGVRHPPHMESVAGSAALAAYVGAYIDTFRPRELDVNTLGKFETEDWGASWGVFDANYTLRRGRGGFTASGSYLSVSSKGADDCWRADWVLWNSDAPPPEPEAE